MNIQFRDLPRMLGRWRNENTSVADTAAHTNLNRIRLICPVVALLNAAHAAVFLLQLLTSSAGEVTSQWKMALLVTHTCMGISMVFFAMVAHQLRYANRTPWGHSLAVVVGALTMAFAIAVVAIDQWVTPNITPFLITCMSTSLALYLRPAPAAGLYVAAYAGFFYAMGLTQNNAALLLSNRLNGIAACVMGWALSVLLWRKFTIITRQQRQLETAHAESQLRQKELERLTRLDGLTGLFNRNTFVELSKQELARAQRQGSATAILLLDLDHFKRVNDTWGHPAGDAVLKHVANIASSTVRSTDLVGRLGGEEFMVLLPNTSLEAARRLAEKLRHRLESTPPEWEGTKIRTTASIGLAGTTASEKRVFESLYNNADKALYLAKQRGRNQVI